MLRPSRIGVVRRRIGAVTAEQRYDGSEAPTKYTRLDLPVRKVLLVGKG